MSNNKKYLAEALGTFVLVLMGCGSAVIAGYEVGNVGIALAFGLSVLVMIYAIGHVSGCHINPAITISMWAFRKMPGRQATRYIVAQFIGAFAGAAVLFIIASGTASYDVVVSGLGQNGYGVASPGGYSLLAAGLTEFMLTAVFLFIIGGALCKKAPTQFAGIAIGLGLALIHIVGIPVTGVSVNPARSFGPALVLLLTGNCLAFAQLWLFIVAPVLGGLFGTWLAKKVED